MAFLDATDWLDIQSTDATNEKRFSQLGYIDAVKDSTPFVDYVSATAREQLRIASSLRSVQIPVIVDQTVVVNTTPGFTFIPDNLPLSSQYTFTAVDVFSGFRHYPAQFQNNSLESDFVKKQVMKNVAYAMGLTIEGLLVTELEARKTQVLPLGQTQVSQGDGTFVFDTGTDTLKINKAAQKETMFVNLEELMNANELPGNYRWVTNRAGLAVQKTEMAKFGLGNSKDLQALGLPTPDRLYESANVSAGSDIFNGFMLRDGAMGVYENFPFDFVNGTEINGKKWSISDMEIPFTRMRANIFVNNDATDATALVSAGTDTNLIMTAFQEMAIWIRFYIVFRFNSDLATRANDIVKIQGLIT